MEPGYEFLVDSREKPELVQKVQSLNIKYRVTTLNTDFVLRRLDPLPVVDLVGAERKAIADLIGSIQSQRIFQQIRRLKMLHEICMLVISGSLAKHKEKVAQIKIHGQPGYRHIFINDNVIYGTLASLAVREGIHIMWLPNDYALLQVVYRFFEKVSEGKYGLEKRAGGKYEFCNPNYWIEMVPGVTRQVSHRLFERFKNIQGIGNANIEELKLIDGIGFTTAKRIFDIFRQEIV